MIGVDIGGSHISSVRVLDVTKGELSGQYNTTHIDISSYGQQEVLDLWAENIQKTIDNAANFDGTIAIAIPGPFNYPQGIVLSHLNAKFKPIEGMNLKVELSKRIRTCERIYFDNDAACCGLGEYYYGLHPHHDKMMAITLGSGIGSSFISNGEIITDNNIVPEGGEVYHLPYKEKKADDYFSTRWFVRRAKEHNHTIEGVKELVKKSNEFIRESLFAEFRVNLLEFLSPIAKKFGATAIIIGGNISKAWPYFGPHITSSFSRINIEVRPSIIGEKAMCLGAARSLHNYMTHEDTYLSR